MQSMDRKKKIFWSFFAVILAALSIWAVVSQSKELSLTQMMEMIRKSEPAWFICGILCMFGFIYFEGAAILSIIKSIGYPRGQREGLIYSASDIYFSAITPSATGGQPASAFFYGERRYTGCQSHSRSDRKSCHVHAGYSYDRCSLHTCKAQIVLWLFDIVKNTDSIWVYCTFLSGGFVLFSAEKKEMDILHGEKSDRAAGKIPSAS